MKKLLGLLMLVAVVGFTACGKKAEAPAEAPATESTTQPEGGAPADAAPAADTTKPAEAKPAH